LIRVKIIGSNGWYRTCDDRIVMTGLCRGSRAEQEDKMPRYVVRFVKDLLGENGRQAEICQCSMEVDAKNKADATELAKKNFCGSQKLSDWSLHADRIQVSDADFPS
jgi:hypothetical protein